jgi:cytochrome c oxidase subunit 2
MTRISAALFAAFFFFHSPVGHAQTAKPIVVHAKRFAFSPAEITVKKGETVTLVFVSDDVAHGLSLPALGIHADILRGYPS